MGTISTSIGGQGTSKVSHSIFQITQNNHQVRAMSWRDSLHQKYVPSAIGDSKDLALRVCEKGTRVGIRKMILDWVNNPGPSSAMWVYGTVGTGKTALAWTISERCRIEGNPNASFFFSRTTSIVDGDSLIPTVVHQFASRSLIFRALVARQIRQNPDIFTKTMDKQMKVLLVNPLNHPLRRPIFRRRKPELVIIDGLDECHDPKVQLALIRAIVFAISKLHVPVRFLVSGRPEPHLKEFFDNPQDFPENHLTCVDIETQGNSDDDIRLYLNIRFEELMLSHPLRRSLPHPWPTSEQWDQLIRNTSGQFIYAVTVAEYVCSRDYDPVKRLGFILENSPGTLDDGLYIVLDSLYAQILANACHQDHERFKDMANLLGILAVTRHLASYEGFERTPNGIGEILGVPCNEILLIARQLRCLLIIDDENGEVSNNTPIAIRHLSLVQYLLKRSRSHEFFVDENSVHGTLAMYYQSKIIQENPTLDPHTLLKQYLIPFISHGCRADIFETPENLSSIQAFLDSHYRTLVRCQCSHRRCPDALEAAISDLVTAMHKDPGVLPLQKRVEDLQREHRQWRAPINFLSSAAGVVVTGSNIVMGNVHNVYNVVLNWNTGGDNRDR